MGFLVLAAVVIAAAHYYLWRRLVVDTTRPGRWRRVFTWAVAGIASVLLLTLTAGRFMDLTWLAWPGYVWVALMFYLTLILAVLEIPRLVARKTVAVDEDRRRLLGRGVALAAGVGAATTVGFGIASALGPPEVTRVPIALPRLDPRVRGLRIAVVSDIHLGPLTGIGHTERIVRLINESEADIVTIVGDLVDGTVAELGDLARPLADLERPSYFVTGNHEYFTRGGPQQWVDELERLGVRCLRNERVEITHGGGVFDLAGINDLGGRAFAEPPDLSRALDGRVPDRAVVLLAHQPVQVGDAAGHGVDLQLSGHTHGGQLWPFGAVVKAQQGAVAGLSEVDGTQLFVTRGAGYWGPPVRVGAPPEITVVELT
ncbi:metallophosphatase [Actinorhabdospora filicis]|uniref:Metallophosphatase n=1 Tax=Actinorhabdospora filicis TaxID=1785913 RepID=A0A9W6W8R9_9ACTN|nr:metallophosphoesterase [Actinorhabdospora filicis]GLZ76761.1 metallophosphatase [Actinorhabdospora filicis]